MSEDARTPLAVRRKLLGITAKDLAHAAHVPRYEMRRPGPAALQRMDAVLCMLEAGDSLAKAAVMLTRPRGSQRARGPAWPEVTEDAQGLSGQCFGGAHDRDPGDGGAPFGKSRPATEMQTASALGGER